MQREIIRIHELWQKAKRELGAKEAEAAEWKERWVASPTAAASAPHARSPPPGTSASSPLNFPGARRASFRSSSP